MQPIVGRAGFLSRIYRKAHRLRTRKWRADRPARVVVRCQRQPFLRNDYPPTWRVALCIAEILDRPCLLWVKSVVLGAPARCQLLPPKRPEKSISKESTIVCHTFSELAEPSPEKDCYMAQWSARAPMRTIQILSWIALLAALAVYWNFGTFSPCGVLREVSRQHDSLAAVLPDSVVDLALAGQFGELSSGRCLAVLIGRPTNNVQTAISQTVQPAVPQSNRRRLHQ